MRTVANRTRYTEGVTTRPEDAARLFADLSAERDSLLEQIKANSDRLQGINQVIGGLNRLFPNLVGADTTATNGAGSLITPTVDEEEAPRGQAAVLRVLAEPIYQGKYWTVPQMTEALVARGWSPDSDRPDNAVRAAFARLLESDERVHKGRGRNGNPVYYFQAPDSPPPHFDEDVPSQLRGLEPLPLATTPLPQREIRNPFDRSEGT